MLQNSHAYSNLLHNNMKKQDAFSSLFKAYYAPFCYYAKQFISNQEVCEDLVSDVFVLVWEKFEAEELHPDTILAYIKACVKNSCLNYMKHQGIEGSYATEILLLHTSSNDIDEEVSPLDELYKRMLEILRQLPQEHRDVFWKSYFEKKSQSEISDEMHISVKSVGRYKSKVIEQLRKELKDNFWIFLI